VQSCLLDRHSTAVYNQPNIRSRILQACVRLSACFRHALVMLYCAAMVDRQGASARLIAQLGGTGLGRILAVILDAAGPLAPIGAQAIYGIIPLLGNGGKDWMDFGQMLEDPDDLEDFIRGLRGFKGEVS
jgi:hypothetical protein